MVIQKIERGVQKTEQRLSKKRVDALHWDDLDFLRGAAATASLRQAAIKLGVSVNTVRSRITRLENALGTILFDRSRDGFFLTVDGIDVLDVAVEMQMLRGKLETGGGNNIVVNHGEISISCSEGIGEFWLTPNLPALNAKLPDYLVSLVNDFDQDRIHSREFDLSIGFARPSDPDTIVTKLATLHFILFASPHYLAKYGNPASFDDLEGHSYVAHVAPGIQSEALGLFVGSIGAVNLTALKVNTSFSLYRAIANGTAIGALPTYIPAISKRVVALDLPVQLKFDLWLSFGRSSKESQPVRAAIDWLRDCFNPDTYPWFADKFVHPRDFPAAQEGLGFVDDLTNPFT